MSPGVDVFSLPKPQIKNSAAAQACMVLEAFHPAPLCSDERNFLHLQSFLHAGSQRHATPGPGSYKLSAPKNSLAASLKFRHEYSLHDSGSPGPAGYVHVTPAGKSPAFTIGARLAPLSKDSQPGPGQYDHE